MRPLLTRFEAALSECGSVLDCVDSLNVIRSYRTLPTPLKRSMLSRNGFSALMFQSGIIGCYSALERLIVDIGETFVYALPLICGLPVELPGLIRELHRDLSLESWQAEGEPVVGTRRRYVVTCQSAGITKTTIVPRLH